MRATEATEEELLNRIAAIKAAAEILDDNHELSHGDRHAFLAVIRDRNRASAGAGATNSLFVPRLPAARIRHLCVRTREALSIRPSSPLGTPPARSSMPGKREPHFWSAITPQIAYRGCWATSASSPPNWRIASRWDPGERRKSPGACRVISTHPWG